jgi:hypothetical protein
MQPATAIVMPAEQEAVMQPASVQLVDLHELAEDAFGHLHRLGHDDRGAQRGHGAGNVDDGAQAKLRTDIGAV